MTQKLWLQCVAEILPVVLQQARNQRFVGAQLLPPSPYALLGSRVAVGGNLHLLTALPFRKAQALVAIIQMGGGLILDTLAGRNGGLQPVTGTVPEALGPP